MSKWASLDPELLDIYQTAEKTISVAVDSLSELALRAQLNNNKELCLRLGDLMITLREKATTEILIPTMKEYANLTLGDKEPFDPDKRVVVKD